MAEASRPVKQDTVFFPVMRVAALDLYTDTAANALTAEFDITTYQDETGSGYMDGSLEMWLSPLVELAHRRGAIFGVPEDQMGDLLKWVGGPSNLSQIATEHEHLRRVVVGKKTIVFPTAELLENFNVRRRP